MVSVSAVDLDTILNLSSAVDAENLEAILDLAIDTLNLYGAAISNMTGDAGEKTVTVTSKEKAAVFIACRAIYYGFYKEISSATVGGLAVSNSNLMSNPVVLATIKQAAHRLEQHEGVPFIVGEATS